MHVQGHLRVLSAGRPVGHLHLWVAETGLADAPAKDVFDMRMAEFELAQDGDVWAIELAFDVPDMPPKGLFSIYASIEANPERGLSKGDWFSRESHDFRDVLTRPFHLTLSRL